MTRKLKMELIPEGTVITKKEMGVRFVDYQIEIGHGIHKSGAREALVVLRFKNGAGQHGFKALNQTELEELMTALIEAHKLLISEEMVCLKN